MSTSSAPDALAVMTELYARVPVPMTHLVVYTLVPADRTAVGYRSARQVVIAVGL